MNESDWKIFKEIKEAALDKCCSNVLSEVHATISDGTKSNHDRFLELYDLVQANNKDIASIFDGHSRSKASLQTMLMRRHGLISDNLVAKFSPELQENTKPTNYE